MRTLTQYILEEGDASITTKTSRGDIKFTIWRDPETKVKWLNDNEAYQKIEYQLLDKEDKLSIDFLLGFKDSSWQLWIGKPGSCSYDDNPYCDFKTDKFAEGIVAALDKVEEFVKKVKDDPVNYTQFYTNL